MGCDGRYSEAWEFAAFWCSGNLLTGCDNSGKKSQACLVDDQQDFVQAGVRANAGMVLYNLTNGASGVITEVDEHSIKARLSGGAGALADKWDAGDEYRVTLITTQERSTIEHYLNITASDVHAALAAQGACDCSLSGWGAGLLKKLNIIEAASFYSCTCGTPNFSDNERQSLREWVANQLELIRTGKTDVCQGGTGGEYPAFGSAELAVTELNAARIIANRLKRDGY